MNVNLTNILAIIGAFTGTTALLWDFFKWTRTGARIDLKATPNMIMVGNENTEPEKDNIFVEVVNIGDKKVTLTHLVLIFYKTYLDKLLKRKDRSYLVPDPLPGKIPHFLDIGERWVGLIEQNDEITKMAKEGYLMIGVIHSSSKKTKFKRVVISPELT